MLRLAAGATVFAALMLADGATSMIDAVDTWRAIGELGLAIVFSAVAFFGMGALVRRNSKEQRADVVRLIDRVTVLENFQQTQLIELTTTATSATVAAVAAVHENTQQLSKMTEALTAMTIEARFRTCAALDQLPDNVRAQVVQMLRGTHPVNPSAP